MRGASAARADAETSRDGGVAAPGCTAPACGDCQCRESKMA